MQELAAIRDALTSPLACAAAKIGDIDTLEALKEMVSLLTVSTVCNQNSISEKRQDICSKLIKLQYSSEPWNNCRLYVSGLFQQCLRAVFCLCDTENPKKLLHISF